MHTHVHFLTNFLQLFLAHSDILSYLGSDTRLPVGGWQIGRAQQGTNSQKVCRAGKE